MPLRKFFLLTYMWHLCASPISIPAFGHLEGAGRNGLSPPPSHPISTTAAFPAIQCRCGMAFFAAPLLQVSCAALCLRPISTTAVFPAIRCRCGMAFIAASFPQAFCAALPFRPVSTTAAFSAVRCRCGMAFIAASFSQAFCAALPFRPVSITAAFSAIQCRCGTTLWKVPTEAAFLHHLLEFVINRPVPEASLAGHAREPHPEGAGESAVCPSPSRFGTLHHLTPSEGVANFRHFPTPSEGVIGPFPDQYLL